MRRLKTDKRNSQKGMTLIETLVSVLIFSIVFLAALGLYQVANRAYLTTDAATIQQQNARYAMDRMSETLRDAGAN
jgi:type IV pilus assembly protein PilW